MKFELNVKKTDVLNAIEKWISDNEFEIIEKDFSRPWGGFFVISEHQKEAFISTFFNSEKIDVLQKMSPKILVVAPNQYLSWQYHHRRSEIWKALNENGVGLKKSNTDLQPEEIESLKKDDIVKLSCGERHRLIGTNEWGVVAEIWQHTDIENPSNEDDIVRVQDDFGR